MDKTCKYYKYQRYVSYDNGQTWQPINQFQRGELMEFNSRDCGAGVEEIYKWVVIEGEFDCEGFDKYELTQKFVSYDNGQTFNPVYPSEYGVGGLLEHNSADCGYVVYDKYRWVDTEEIICVEEDDCSVDFLNPYNDFATIRNSGSTVGFGDCLTFKNVKNTDAWNTDDNTRDLVLNTACYTIVNTNPPMSMMSSLTALTVTNNVSGHTDMLYPPARDVRRLVIAKYGCNINRINLLSNLNFLYNDNPNNIELSTASYAKLYVPQSAVSEYRALFSESSVSYEDEYSYLIYPFREYPLYTFTGPRYTTLENSGYTCDGYNKLRVEDLYYSPDGSTPYSKVNTFNTDTIIEYESPDCGFVGVKFTGIYANGDVKYIDCTSSSSLTESEISGIGTTNLVSGVIGNCTTSIGRSAFTRCYSLSSVTIPNTVTSIENAAFNYCTGLTNVAIPNSVTSIGGTVFNGCRSLESITIPNSVISFGDNMLYGCNSLTSITINSRTIKNCYHCGNLAELIIGDNTNSIDISSGQGCFEQCSLSTVTLGSNLTNIGNRSFYECSGFTSIEIPESVTNIGSQAFSMCWSLSSLTMNSIVPPTLGNNALNGTGISSGNGYIYVPNESVELYKNANEWSRYSNVIIGV